jgi:hypothetical protein
MKGVGGQRASSGGPTRFAGRPRAISVDADEVLRALAGPLRPHRRARPRAFWQNETLDPAAASRRALNHYFMDNLMQGVLQTGGGAAPGFHRAAR